MSEKQSVLGAGVQVPSLSPGLGLKQEIAESPQIKEEPEEVQLQVPVPESSAVCVKREESSPLTQRQTEDISSETHFRDISETAGPSLGDDVVRVIVENVLKTEADGDLDEVQTRDKNPAEQTLTESLSDPVNCEDLLEAAEEDQKKIFKCPVCHIKVMKKYVQFHLRIHTEEELSVYSLYVKKNVQKTPQNQATDYRGTAAQNTSECPENSSISDGDTAGVEEVEWWKNNYQCSVCDKSFTTKARLHIHCTVHKGEGPFSCSCCEKMFNPNSSLQSHIRSHQRFSVKEYMGAHEELKCLVCESDFPDECSLREHLKTHIEQNSSSCLRASECERMSVDSELRPMDLQLSEGVQDPSLSPGLDLKQETPESPQMKEEPEEEQLQVPDADFWGTCSTDIGAQGKKRKCPFCEKIFYSRQGAKKHLKVHMGETAYSCFTSNKKFDQKYRHDVDFWETCSSDIGIEGKKRRCPFCEKTFYSRQGAIKHLIVHTGDKPYSCPTCDKKFDQKYRYEEHLRAHRGETLTCLTCDKTYMTKSGFDFHMKTHTRETIICSVCSKTFTSSSLYKTHMETHTRESYSCSACSRTFLFRSTLEAHMKSHARESHSCSVCSKTFLSRSALEAHVKSHTGETYMCSLCSDTFASASSLKEHMKSHGTTFLCPLCAKICKDRSKLEDHLSLEHSPDNPVSCSICRRTFAKNANLVSHMRIHRPRDAAATQTLPQSGIILLIVTPETQETPEIQGNTSVPGPEVTLTNSEQGGAQ